MHAEENLKPLALDLRHVVAEDVPGECLGTVLNDLAAVGLDARPLACVLVDAVVAYLPIVSNLRVDVAQVPARRQTDPQPRPIASYFEMRADVKGDAWVLDSLASRFPTRLP